MATENHIFKIAFQIFKLSIIGVFSVLLLSSCSPEKSKISDSDSSRVLSQDHASLKSNIIGTEISVTGGIVRGLASKDETSSLKRYLGIPFAAPPLGELRWAPPAPVIPWKGTLDATMHGHYCMQPETSGIGIYINKRSNPSEDCLTINVWTRAKSTDEKKPVMFWIHGGALQGGAGFERGGEALTKKDVVLVLSLIHI